MCWEALGSQLVIDFIKQQVYSVAVSPDADISQMGSAEISATIYSVRKEAIGCNKVV